MINHNSNLLSRESLLCFITAHRPDFEARLCDHLPATIQPIRFKGSTSSIYVVLLPEGYTLDAARLDAGKDNGEFYTGPGADILLNSWVFRDRDRHKLADNAPMLSADQCEQLIALFDQGRL